MAQITTPVTLPVINNRPVGVINVYLYHDDSIVEHTDIEYPTSVLFLSVGKIRESIDAEAGVTEFDNVDIEVREDYSNHPEGFWHRLINGYPDFDFELMFTIMEGTDETFSFRGKIYRENIEETEHYLDTTTGVPSKVVRGVKFKLVSSLKILENISIQNLRTEVLVNDEAGNYKEGVAIWQFVTLKTVFACMMKLAYGIIGNIGDIEDLVVNNSTDIQLQNGETDEWISFLDAYIWSSIFQTAEEISPNTHNGQYIYRFSNAFELLKHLCGMFGVIPRYSFGDENGLLNGSNNHRILLNSRGRTGATVTMTGKLTDSKFISDSPRKSQRIKAAWYYSDDFSAWYQNGVLKHGTPASYIEFDVVKAVDFNLQDYEDLSGSSLLYKNSVSGHFYPITKCRFWNYAATPSAYVERIQVGQYGLAGALAEYLFNRMTDGRVQYEREYGSIKANDTVTNSQRNCVTTMRHIINDGMTERTFYATEVEKDIMDNRCKIIWVEE